MRKLIITLSLSLMALSAFAQRTVSGTSVIEICGGLSLLDEPGTSVSASVAYGQYTIDGIWTAGVDFLNRIRETDLETEYDVTHITADFTRQWRIAATWNRILNLYAGVGAQLGVELLDPRSMLSAGERIEGSSALFLYGINGVISAEAYMMPYFSLYATAKPILMGGSRLGYYCMTASIGLRFSF